MSDVPQPKMINSPKYLEGYTEIDWGSFTCVICGKEIKKSDLKNSPDLFTKYSGDKIGHKKCKN